MRITKIFRMKSVRKLTMLLILGITLSCSEESIDGTLTESQADLENLQASSVEKKSVTTSPMMFINFKASVGQLPESIAIDVHGNIYASMPFLGEVWKLDPAGASHKVVARFAVDQGDPGVLGLSLDNQGNLFVAVSVESDLNGVWKIDQNGNKEKVAGSEKISFPNDVAVLPNGTVYITDSSEGAIWRSLPGAEAELWAQNESLEGNGIFPLPQPVGANGIVVTRRSDKGTIGGVVVSNTEKGQLVKVPILPDGSAGDPEILFSDPVLLTGLDGLTQDAGGNIYGTVNVGNNIVKFSKDGSEVYTLASGTPLDFPTSLAFGTGKEKHTLFITNFSLLTVMGPNPDNANPGVIALEL